MMLIVMMKKVKFGSETKKIFMPKRMIHRKKNDGKMGDG